MVRHVDGAGTFVLGTLLEVVVAAGVIAYLRVRRRI
jgi:hypothetical protein